MQAHRAPSPRSEAAIADAVHQRDVDRLRRWPSLDILVFLTHAWDREGRVPHPDFDRLFDAGWAAAQLELAEAETRMKEWLERREPLDENRADVAACFLVGYWPYRERVDTALAATLTSRLEKSPLGRDPRDMLVLALASALPKLNDRALSERITSRFRSLWNERESAGYQPSVHSALAGALGLTESA